MSYNIHIALVQLETKNLKGNRREMSTRILPTPEENSYYETLFSLASPDLTGSIPGKTGAQFLSTSGLARDVLHKIWSIADAHQHGKLDREGFYVACRLVAHAQSGLMPDVSLAGRQPAILPIFEGVKKKQSNEMNHRMDDVISLSDYGADNGPTFMDPSRAANIVSSMARLGMDPLEFIPFQSGPDVSIKPSEDKSQDWTITEVNRHKYTGLFRKLDKDALGRISGKAARAVLERSGLSRQTLGVIWELSDLDSDGLLNEKEFVLAMHLTTKCKKGSPLPSAVPDALLDQLDANAVKLPSFGNNDISKPTTETWKYSRTYLDSAVEDERRLRSSLDGQAEETEEEMRNLFDMCAQVESDIGRMKIELDKRKSLVSELERNKKELIERKAFVTDTRKTLNIDRISLNRDRAKLQSEIIHLKKVLTENSKDVEILRQAVGEEQAAIDKILVQTRTLELQRRDAVRQHSEEMDKIESEQRETSQLVESWNRLSREDEIRLESDRIRNEKERIIAEMQKNPLNDARITSTSAFAEKNNKWATSILQPDSSRKVSNEAGFGTSFFASSK
jgi:hypothetical protein